VNNTPLFPPAERFGLSLIALIRAIAGQAGWVVPRWLVAKVEAEIWGFVEALSLLVAVVKEANLAAAAAAQQGAETPSFPPSPSVPAAPAGRPSARRGRQGGTARRTPRHSQASGTGPAKARRPRRQRPAPRVVPRTRRPHPLRPQVRASGPPIFGSFQAHALARR
jgi:hypothetical protein